MLTLRIIPEIIRALTGGLAQLVEQRTLNPFVGSSILPSPTNYINGLGLIPGPFLFSMLG